MSRSTLGARRHPGSVALISGGGITIAVFGCDPPPMPLGYGIYEVLLLFQECASESAASALLRQSCRTYCF